MTNTFLTCSVSYTYVTRFPYETSNEINKERKKKQINPKTKTNVLINVCEYRIPEASIKNALSYWGELTSDIEEERFRDPMIQKVPIELETTL